MTNVQSAICNPQSTLCLTPEQKKQFLELLARGASLSSAAGKTDVPVSRYLQAAEEDRELREGCEESRVTQGHHVVTALYNSALKGNVSAQTFWLKCNPPPGWIPDAEEPFTSIDAFFDKLSEEELLELARAMDIDLPPEIETESAPEGGAPISRGVPS